MDVGIRELRNDLSKLLKRVREGEEIVVTDRGKPIARIVPAQRSRFDELVDEGAITPAVREWEGPLPKPVEIEGGLSRYVLEDRR